MKKTIDLGLNYFDKRQDMDALIKQEFYKAKEYLFNLGYEEYVEEKSLPLSPRNENIFYPLATYRVRDTEGNFNWIDIFQMALGGMLVTDEL